MGSLDRIENNNWALGRGEPMWLSDQQRVGGSMIDKTAAALSDGLLYI